jgi:3-methylfumaryl-CoA hydratase
MRLMQATLDQGPNAQSGDPSPPMWHYLNFNPEVRAYDLKEDGHEALGRFLSPVDPPRRMWVGARGDQPPR